MHEDCDDADEEDDDDHHHHHQNMSRLSVCISNSKHSTYSYENDDVVEDELDEDTMINMSRLSVDDGSDIDADAELSDTSGKEETPMARWSSLPTTPQRRLLPGHGGVQGGAKEYASETEERGLRRRGWRRRVAREKGLERAWEMRKCRAMDGEMECGESECVVVARSKGGGRCLSMDLEEVKACRDLGFQLHNDWTLEIPSRVSGSTIDTDSSGNSPIANWRISSPGEFLLGLPLL